ncbi:DUF707 domain-containing protein [Deminuibacter soli]|uniref:DUF707 domain-containing protein n=1 Tax=Deminuibacter soli TaxID=2291815 RepID=A0A3E1NQT0_9BACT|nr:DUF707 domain-containing protein [Deminuibacter soli]RFM30174.1 DUF707 domain-containing protein [Deminuibacter soli]
MANRNIIIAPCGNKSYLFRDSWLKHPEKRAFDVCLMFYHEQINAPEKYAGIDFFYHLKDFKYFMIHELLTRIHPEWLQQYDYFYFLDDDIEIDTLQINQLFALSRAFNSSISQASLSRDSFCSWPMFKQKRDSFCRYVGQIEVMSPLFSAQALQTCMPSFTGNRSSWGVDSVWSKLLGYPEDKLVVFDTVTMKHTLPVGGGELYQKIGVDPQVDWKKITDDFGARKQNYREYGRLQLVNKRSNRIVHSMHMLQQAWASVKRAWNDYDPGSRIISRKNKLLRKLKLVAH